MADTEVEGSDLSAIIADEIRSAQTFDQSKRALAIEYMRGEMNDIPARANGSSQTSRDVADTIGWMLPGIIRVFTASDQMVEFEATQEGGEQGAQEASEYTNYSFFRENDGYRILRTATSDSLQLGNGAACSYWCPEVSKTKLFRDKTAEELALLLEEGWQGLGVPPQQTGFDDETQQPTFTVRLKLISERGQIKDESLKPENLLLNGTAVTIEEARFAAYLHDDLTRSDLLGMADEYGWDREVIKQLPSFSRRNQNEVATARNARQTVFEDAPTRSGELIDLYRCFIRVDQDGDGEAELLQVWYAGNAGQGAVLSSDEWEDDIPFTDIPCYPVAHQWQAEGVYDREADVQRVKTLVLRQFIDNTYAVGLPQREVEVGSVQNPDALINQKFGGILWKTKGSAPIVPHVIPFIGDKLMMALEYMDNVTAKRTGVSRTTMALDPEALQNQTATASQNQRDAAYSQIELVARDMAELGWAKFFAKRRNLAKKYIKGGLKIPSRKNGDQTQGQEGSEQSRYRTIQPEAWADDMACTINVGLGTGSRDRDMMMLSGIQNDQMMMANMLGQYGFQNQALEFIPKIIKTAVQKAESAGLKNPDDYYPAFDDNTVQQMRDEAAQKAQQPDPAIMLEQERGKTAIAVEQAKGQVATQNKQVDAQVSAHEAELKAQGEVAKNTAELQADLQTKEADRQNAIIIAREQGQIDLQKQERELAWKTWDAEQNRQLEREKLANAAQIAAMKPRPEPGKGANK